MVRTPFPRRPRFSAAWGALICLAGYVSAWLLHAGGLRFVFGLLLIVFVFVLALRQLRAWRRRLLWRLRNRLLVTYLFIAVVPILLILGMVALTSYMLYGQLAGYLIASELESKAQQLGALNLGLTAELASHSPRARLNDPELQALLRDEEATLRVHFSHLHLVLAAGKEHLEVPPGSGLIPCARRPPWATGEFQGLVNYEDHLYLHSITLVPNWKDTRVCVTVPVDEDLLSQVATNIGRFSLIVLQEVAKRPREGPVFIFGNRTFVPGPRVSSHHQPLPPARYAVDPVLNSASKFNVVQWDLYLAQRTETPVFVTIRTRPSLLNERIFAPLGEVAQALLTVLGAIGVIFLLLELVSLITGARLTRSVTRAVQDLYNATQRVQVGDFSVRVLKHRDDQLGALSDSFNQMAASIERLIEESKEKQRLQNELEIARQVQEQLFPRAAPELKTLTLVSRCRPARTVSGDYYDFGLAQPGRLIFTIGDISGKGISAALLMATIQSILRSQVYSARLRSAELDGLSAAELVSRVNRQLCATTSPEKYSTLFVGFYDDESRRLTYTNAGHLPPVVLNHGRRRLLETGGPVVGLFDDLTYKQETVELEAGDWLVGYTDGLTEAENSYEEEYGSQRLLAFIERSVGHSTPEQLIDAVLEELQAWAPGEEQSDDRTLLVARVR